MAFGCSVGAAAQHHLAGHEIATSVRGYFVDLVTCLEELLALGVRQGSMNAFDDPRRFHVIVEASIARVCS